ncbi:MAG: hypothetical protein AAFV53_17200 [Myxococcota bacterium]
MRTIIAILAAGTMAACDDSGGEWRGECDIGEVEISVTMSLTDDEGDLSGSGTMSYTTLEDQISEDATVSGFREGNEVEIELQPDTVGEMEIDAVMDGDVLSGTCMWASIEGTARLER